MLHAWTALSTAAVFLESWVLAVLTDKRFLPWGVCLQMGFIGVYEPLKSYHPNLISTYICIL